MNTRSQRQGLAGLLGRFLRHERGSISPLFVLMLIPMCGVMAMAIEVGNGLLQQRTEQHAADSAALTAATGNNVVCYTASGAKDGSQVVDSSGNCPAGDTPGFVLEAKAVSQQYPIDNATVTTAQAYCPGTTSGSFDCYAVNIRRTTPFYLGQIVGVRTLTSSATAYARTTATVDLCFATTSDFTTDGKSTGFNTCYVESFNGTIKCTSVAFAGLFAGNTQACGTTPTSAPSAQPSCSMPMTGVTPCLAGSIPDTTTVPCDANPTDPTKWVWKSVSTGTPSTTTNYVRLCGTSANGYAITLASNMSLLANANNQAVILDNATINGNAGMYSVTALNTTFISTCANSTCATLPVPFQNLLSGNGTTGLEISGPLENTGTFANFALYDNENLTPAAAFNYSFNDNITGEIYEPNRAITQSGSQASSIGGITCVTMVAASFYSNGGKLVNNPVADCAGNYQVAQHTIANVALVK